MNEDFSKLLSPFQFPVSGIQVDNRIVMAPMTTFSGNEDGTVSDDELSYYKERNRGAGFTYLRMRLRNSAGKSFSRTIQCLFRRYVA